MAVESAKLNDSKTAMIKTFSWKTYDGRRIVLCGGFRLCFPIILGMPEGLTLYICDEEYAGQSLSSVLEPYQQEAKKSGLADALREVHLAFKRRICFIACSELAQFRDDYVILVGKTFFKRYCRNLGFKGIADFYFATPVLKNGYAKQTYFSYFAPLFRRQRDGLYLGGAEAVVTEKCTLRCRDCANLMQYYDNPARLDGEELLRAVKSLLRAVDGIAYFKIIGGEPLLEQKLICRLLELPELNCDGKVLGVLIICNGTLSFSDELLHAMQNNPLVSVLLSNYDGLSCKEQEIRKQLESAGISYSEIAADDTWQDYGKPDQQYVLASEADDQFGRCNSKDVCCTVLNGRLYHCPRAAHGAVLGYYPDDGIPLLTEPEDNESPEGPKNRLSDFYHRAKAPAACMYCRGSGGERIPRALQQSKGVKA